MTMYFGLIIILKVTVTWEIESTGPDPPVFVWPLNEVTETLELNYQTNGTLGEDVFLHEGYAPFLKKPLYFCGTDDCYAELDVISAPGLEDGISFRFYAFPLSLSGLILHFTSNTNNPDTKTGFAVNLSNGKLEIILQDDERSLIIMSDSQISLFIWTLITVYYNYDDKLILKLDTSNVTEKIYLEDSVGQLNFPGSITIAKDNYGVSNHMKSYLGSLTCLQIIPGNDSLEYDNYDSYCAGGGGSSSTSTPFSQPTPITSQTSTTTKPTSQTSTTSTSTTSATTSTTSTSTTTITTTTPTTTSTTTTSTPLFTSTTTSTALSTLSTAPSFTTTSVRSTTSTLSTSTSPPVSAQKPSTKSASPSLPPTTTISLFTHTSTPSSSKTAMAPTPISKSTTFRTPTIPTATTTFPPKMSTTSYTSGSITSSLPVSKLSPLTTMPSQTASQSHSTHATSSTIGSPSATSSATPTPHTTSAISLSTLTTHLPLTTRAQMSTSSRSSSSKSPLTSSSESVISSQPITTASAKPTSSFKSSPSYTILSSTSVTQKLTNTSKPTLEDACTTYSFKTASGQTSSLQTVTMSTTTVLTKEIKLSRAIYVHATDKNPSKCRRYRKQGDDVSFDANDVISTTETDDVHHCLQLCDHHDDCEAYSYKQFGNGALQCTLGKGTSQLKHSLGYKLFSLR